MFDSSAKVDRYLGKVYGLATLGLATAAYGARLHLEGVVRAGFMMTLAQIVLLIGVSWTEFSARQQYKDGGSPLRYGLFLAFSLCAGVNVGSFVEFSLKQAFGPHHAVSLDDNLIYEAFVLSSLLFGVFTAAGLLATPGMLFIASVAIGVGSMITFWTWIASFFGLVSLLAMEAVFIRLGMIIFSAYILVDTWVILQQAQAGIRDVVTHAITLLTDFLQLFVRVLYVLAKSQKEKKKN